MTTPHGHLLLLCLALTLVLAGCLRPLQQEFFLDVRNNLEQRPDPRCPAGMQARVTIGKAVLESPLVANGREAREQMRLYSLPGGTPVTVEAWCHVDAETIGYGTISGQLHDAFFPYYSVEVISADEQHVEGCRPLNEATDPEPCIFNLWF